MKAVVIRVPRAARLTWAYLVLCLAIGSGCGPTLEDVEEAYLAEYEAVVRALENGEPAAASKINAASVRTEEILRQGLGFGVQNLRAIVRSTSARALSDRATWAIREMDPTTRAAIAGRMLWFERVRMGGSVSTELWPKSHLRASLDTTVTSEITSWRAKGKIFYSKGSHRESFRREYQYTEHLITLEVEFYSSRYFPRPLPTESSLVGPIPSGRPRPDGTRQRAWLHAVNASNDMIEVQATVRDPEARTRRSEPATDSDRLMLLLGVPAGSGWAIRVTARMSRGTWHASREIVIDVVSAILGAVGESVVTLDADTAGYTGG